MALDKQVLPIAFGQGINSKDDPKQLMPGKLTDLKNASFQTGKEIKKRPGFAALPALSAGVSVSAYEKELVTLDGQNLYSLNQSGNAQTLKGPLETTNLNVTNVVRTTTQQTVPDSAINGTFRCFVWYDSLGQLGYSVFDTATNQSIVNNQTLAATGIAAKVLSLGTNFVIVYSDTGSIYYKTISTSTPTVLSARTLIAADADTNFKAFDASVFNSRIYIAYGTTTASTVGLYYLTSGLVLSTKQSVATSVTPSTVTVFGDASFNVWVGYAQYASASAVANVYAFISNPNLTSVIVTEKLLEAVANSDGARNITGIVSGTTGRFCYEAVPLSTAFVSTELTPNFVRVNTMTLAGTVGTAQSFKRGVGLASKVFSYNSVNHVLVAYQSKLQSGYFLVNDSGNVVLKLSPQSGGGYTALSILPEVNFISANTYQIASLVKDSIVVAQGKISTQTGVLAATVTFTSTDPVPFQIAKNLHIPGGILNMYDGSNVVEHGFNVYPEGVTTSFAPNSPNLNGSVGIGSSAKSINQFQYVALYEWTDNLGQNHRSAPSIPITVAVPDVAPVVINSVTWGGPGSATITNVPAGSVKIGQYVSYANPNGRRAFPTPNNNFYNGAPYNFVVSNVVGTTVTLGSSQSGTAPSAGEVQNMIVSNYPLGLYYADPRDGTDGVYPFIQALATPPCGVGQKLFPAGGLSRFSDAVYVLRKTTTDNIFTASETIGNPGFFADSGVTSLYYSADVYSIRVNVPTLKLTDKQKVSLAVYRTAVNGSIFYRTTSQTSLIYNDPTVDFIQITDSTGDGQLIGNEQLYTSGGEIENISAPAVNASITFKSRPVVLPSENQLSWWYGKQVLPGAPAEFSDVFVNNVDSNIGAIKAVGVLDEKLIFFGAKSKYLVVGDGPAASGANNDYSQAQHITGSTGCVNQASILEIPIGLLYQDPSKGIYLLDRSLQEQYIGKDVERFNSQRVTSAQTIPGTTSVKLTLDSGTVLTFDWFEQQWGFDVLPNPAISSTIFQDKMTYIEAGGAILQQTPSAYLDTVAFVPMSMKTGWMSFAGVEGFQRVKRLLILGNYKSPHTLTVNVYTDFDDTAPTQTVTIPVIIDPVVYQYRIHILKQKCESIRIEILETQSPPYGEGYSLSTMAFEVGVKRGPAQLSAGKSF